MLVSLHSLSSDTRFSFLQASPYYSVSFLLAGTSLVSIYLATIVYGSGSPLVPSAFSPAIPGQLKHSSKPSVFSTGHPRPLLHSSASFSASLYFLSPFSTIFYRRAVFTVLPTIRCCQALPFAYPSHSRFHSLPVIISLHSHCANRIPQHLVCTRSSSRYFVVVRLIPSIVVCSRFPFAYSSAIRFPMLLLASLHSLAADSHFSVSLASSCSCSQPLLGCCISHFRFIPFQSVPSTVDSVVPLRRLPVCYILRRILRPLSTPSLVACSLSMCGQLLSSLPLWHTQPQSASVISSVVSLLLLNNIRPHSSRDRCVFLPSLTSSCISSCVSVNRSSWIVFRPIVSHPDSFPSRSSHYWPQVFSPCCCRRSMHFCSSSYPLLFLPLAVS